MGFFDFLKPVERTVEHAAGNVFNFLTQPEKKKQQPSDLFKKALTLANPALGTILDPRANTVRDLAVTTARAPVRAAASVGKSIGDVVNQSAGLPEQPAFQPSSNPLAEAVLGTEPIKSFQQRQAGTEQALKGTPAANLATPLSFLGVAGSIGADITPFGAGKGKALETGLEQLAKATTESEVKNIMKGTPQEIINKVAPAITQTKDPNIVKNIIDRATAQTISKPIQDVNAIPTSTIRAVDRPSLSPGTPPGTPPTPVTGDLQAGQGSANPVQNVVDALRGQPGASGQSPVTGVETLQRRQAGLYSTERSARLAQAQNTGDLTGREAMQAQRSALEGRLPKVDATALVDHLKSTVKPEDVNGILDTLRTSPHLQGYEPITAQNSIVKLFDEGKLPTPKEWEILQKSLGSDLTDTLKTTAVDSMSGIQKVKNFGLQVLGMPKAVMASTDLSGGLRQGALLGSRFPKVWGNAQKESVKYFASEDAFQRGMQGIAKSDNFPIYQKMGLDLALPGGAHHEEQYASTLAEKIPLGGKPIRASDRAYTGGLTQLRAGAADTIIGDLRDSGIDVNTLGDKSLKSIGKFINTASGRGVGKKGGIFEKYAPVLGDTLFSPRLWKSRLDMLNPAYYAKLDPTARKYALQSAGSFAGIAATVLGLAAAAGAQVVTDARSSDFLKIKVGDTRYDILGGFQQNLVFAWREISGQKKSSITGNVTDLTAGKYGQANRFSVLTDLIQNKENPAFAPATNILKGTDKAGNPVNPAAEIGKLFVPLNIQDTYSTIKNTGSIPKGILKSTIPGTVGIGVGTYGLKDIKPTKKQQTYIDKNITDPAQKEAYTRFFQTAKVAAGTKTNASDEIKKAIKAGDMNKATEIARTYNKTYNNGFNDWRKKYGKYVDGTLSEQYNKNLITPDSFNRWLKEKNNGTLLQ